MPAKTTMNDVPMEWHSDLKLFLNSEELSDYISKIEKAFNDLKVDISKLKNHNQKKKKNSNKSKSKNKNKRSSLSRKGNSDSNSNLDSNPSFYFYFNITTNTIVENDYNYNSITLQGTREETLLNATSKLSPILRNEAIKNMGINFNDKIPNKDGLTILLGYYIHTITSKPIVIIRYVYFNESSHNINENNTKYSYIEDSIKSPLNESYVKFLHENIDNMMKIMKIMVSFNRNNNNFENESKDNSSDLEAFDKRKIRKTN
ncbi:hypothetical protein U3516DRAFT_739487 [Neocallimastix sp. 'constans']